MTGDWSGLEIVGGACLGVLYVVALLKVCGVFDERQEDTDE